MTTKLKRPISFLLAFVVAMVFHFPIGITNGITGIFNLGLPAKAAETITPKKPSGSGSSSDPYQIGTKEELYWFAEFVNGSTTNCDDGTTANTAACAKLTKDIAVNSGVIANLESGSFTDWTPIGSETNQYTGTFDGLKEDGSRCTISGLYFNNTSTSYVGLFGYLGEDGSVSNVGVVDSYFRGDYYVGGVCGYNGSDEYNGYGGTIENCYNEGTVSGSSDYVGGVCGLNDNGTITNCYNEGTVSGSSDSYCVGGVCGETYFGTIENCYNTGTVSGSSKYVGGVCGETYYGTITGCYNEGKVSGSSNVGGVCGYNYYGTIENCYNTGSVSGSENVGGVCGKNDNGTIAKCYYLKTDTINKDINAIGNEDSETVDKAESKTTTDFTDGTICGLVGYHSHQNGICIWCGAYEPATLTNDRYDINGDNTPDVVYEISSAGQLYWFEAIVNSETMNANAVLTADITVNKDVLKSDGTLSDIASGFTSWTPIGYYNSDSDCRPYTGTFDGQGHTISGLYFNDTKDYVGLFGYVGGNGRVLNVGVVDSYFSGSQYVGGVCGYNKVSGTIENCYNEGKVSGSSDSYCVGGVCGYNNKGTITNSYNTGTVSGSNYVGGVCGNDIGTTKSCYNTGAVSGSYYVGGVCGEKKIGTITGCYYLANSETDSIDGTTYKTAEQFASGEVAYLLQSVQTTVDAETGEILMVWGQTIGTDAYPVFYKNNTVYYGYADCNATDKTYTNIQHDEYGHSYTGENHACSYCSNPFAVIEVNYAAIETAVDKAREVAADGTIGDEVDVKVTEGSNVITCAIALNGSEPAVDSYELKIFNKDNTRTPLAETGISKYKKILNGVRIDISIIQIVYDLENNTAYTVELTLYDAKGNVICTQETDYPTTV